MPHTFQSLGFMIQNQLIAYSIFEPQSGDITQLAVHREFRRKGLGSSLLKEVLKRIPDGTFKIINTETTYKPLTVFLEKLHIKPSGKQYEMLKRF